MEKEILHFIKDFHIDYKFIDYGLHCTPEKMCFSLQKEISRVAKKRYKGIVLGYGLCSNGIVGLKAEKQPIIVPKIHDCISLFLGSPKSYQKQINSQPGTYYLTPGWIEKGQTPLSKFENYRRSYNKKIAMLVLKDEMKHYTRIALIDTGLFDISQFREYARKNAALLGLKYEELKGSPLLFRKLLFGPWDKDFLIIKKGQTISQEMFLNL
jgi:hypothetical protein